MEKCQSILLGEIPNSNVAKCLPSGLIRWYYNNLMVTFHEEDFKVFSKSFGKIDFNKKGWGTPDGKRFVIINTCHEQIQFVFKEYEHERLCFLFEKALAELEIRQILKS